MKKNKKCTSISGRNVPGLSPLQRGPGRGGFVEVFYLERTSENSIEF